MEMTKILINIPENLADGMTAIGNEYQVSRNRMVVEACKRFLEERPKAIGSLRPSSSHVQGGRSDPRTDNASATR